MSTKSSILLTNDHDEHWYTDFIEGDDMIIEISLKNGNVVLDHDDDCIIIQIKEGSELYKLLKQIHQK